MLGNSCPNTFQPKSSEETFLLMYPLAPDIHRSRPLEALSCGQFDLGFFCVFFVCEIIPGIFFLKFAGLEAEGELEDSSLSACLFFFCVRLMFAVLFFFLPLSRDGNQRGHKEKELWTNPDFFFVLFAGHGKNITMYAHT